MTPGRRRNLFLAAAAIFAGLFLWGFWGLPGFGHYPGPYGDVINHVVVPERHITDAITAVNLDFRGVDTIGEEFILFAAVIGVAVLLRALRTERARPPEDEAAGRVGAATSDAVRVVALAAVAPTALLGLYVVTHGQLTPGGGFQGGVILATAVLLVYLAGEYVVLRRVSPLAAMEAAEAVGAGGFAVLGLVGVVAGGAFLQNTLPLGVTGSIDSGGMVSIINALVGLEVAAGFVIIISEFLEQALSLRRGGRA
ncbi:MAG: MnhB domain-containing protein [Candidatus Dormibacteraceae bacterium]